MISFVKYHGLGNDFVIVDYQTAEDDNLSSLAIEICDRHTGIGADGLIAVKQHPLEMIYYNSDGSRAKMCGNGIRCFANYVIDQEIVDSDNFTVRTLAGDYHISVESVSPFTCKVNMGKPDFTAKNIPVNTTNEMLVEYPITIQEDTYNITSLFMGTIHTTVEVENFDEADIVSIGTHIQSLDLFPDSTNVNVYQVIDEETVKMQTYERGAGLTLACGTGATAVYSVLQKIHNINHPVEFQLPLGTLQLETIDQDIYMTGPAEFVFVGTYDKKGRD
jgi:diaminopimelate epimerase